VEGGGGECSGGGSGAYMEGSRVMRIRIKEWDGMVLTLVIVGPMEGGGAEED